MSINTNEVTDILTPTGGNLGLNGNVVVPQSSGTGIKVGMTSPSFPWRDITGPLVARGTGPTDPTWTAFINGIRAYAFSVGDELWVTLHCDHDFVVGSDLFIHAHYAFTTAPTSGSVTWNIEATAAKGHQQQAFSTTINTSVTQTLNTTAFFHHIAEVQLSTPGGSATMLDSNRLEPDTLILVRISLGANSHSAGTEPHLLACDGHYMSSGIGTRNKAPNFFSP